MFLRVKYVIIWLKILLFSLKLLDFSLFFYFFFCLFYKYLFYVRVLNIYDYILKGVIVFIYLEVKFD